MAVQIKICGIKTLSEALAAVEAGADYLGFNFYSKSVRHIDASGCARIASVLKKEAPSVRLVGVFVNSSLDEIGRIMDACLLDLAQLHGDESVDFCKALGRRAFKALRGISVGQAQKYSRSEAPAFLVDAPVNGSYGGTGSTADWPAAAELAKLHPFFLAGGLKAENVAQAVQRVRPWGVDVASGVESRPGVKDPQKMKAFVETVRRLEAEA